MAAAYLVATGQRSGGSALIANLSVGPPSLEQVLYAATWSRTELLASLPSSSRS